MEQKLRGYQLQVFLGSRFSVFEPQPHAPHESTACSPCECVLYAPAHTQHRMNKSERPLN